MDYALEGLGPESFQQLCQALIVKAFPAANCMPVGQPDGGRDAVSLDIESGDRRPFTVFQIKFSRNAKDGADARAWVQKTIEDEIIKAQKLIEKGANQYILVTNVSGTSHLDAGSIDIVQQKLQQEIRIPVICWWRDDINRRLDDSWDIKLRFPQILTGSDFLRLLLESRFRDDHQRRFSAIKAFLVDQYDEDVDVKFKQVELQNKLLDLFVDLPFRVRLRNPRESTLDLTTQPPLPVLVFGSETGKSLEMMAQEDTPVGTATLLLATANASSLSQLVVEGAPGQGKSTLAQYLCQVHRIRWLHKEQDLSLLPAEHKNAPLALPFKVDLRDLATWIGGGDPFASGEMHQATSDQRTLETFLAHLVQTRSGGHPFSVTDLLDVAKHAPLLIVLDGLDEVADIKRRADIVSGVTKSASRLREVCLSPRIVVTSRPTAFANSPGFDLVRFPILELGSVQKEQINAYAARWMTARSLSRREKQEFQQILDEKLDEPHLRDLARNPMQLTILLSLIHTRGAALPDKRTSLYDSYVDLFFSREAAKSATVRKYADLLKDIPGFLGWSLHSDAENARVESGGRISGAALQAKVREYLEREKHSTAVLEEVFKATVERVFMIVSRIEGTYEFEVQPLREYFAARFLYDTAPYSPPGKERPGTKPDRFDAIARNSYWLNVVRFFCGCFSKGELLDLADRVKELSLDDDLKDTRYPVALAAMLLSDWVFAQAPRAVEELVRFLTQRVSILRMLADPTHPSTMSQSRIPETCGSEAIARVAFDMLAESTTRSDLASYLIRLLSDLCDRSTLSQIWLDTHALFLSNPRRWCAVGARLELFSGAPQGTIETMFNSDPAAAQIIVLSRPDLLSHHPDWLTVCVDSLLNSGTLVPFRGGEPFFLFPTFLSLSHYWRLTHARYIPDFLRTEVSDFKTRNGFIDPKNFKSDLERQLYDISVSIADTIPSEKLLTNLHLSGIEVVVERMHALWGDRPIILQLAASVAHGPKPGRPKACSLLDRNVPLIQRIRYARTQAKKVEYWKRQFEAITSPDDLMVFELAYRTWAPASCFAILHGDIGPRLDDLVPEEWDRLVDLICNFNRRPGHDGIDKQLAYTGGNNSPRELLLTAHAANHVFARDLFLRHFREPVLRGRDEGKFRQKWAFECAIRGEIPWDEALTIIRQTYAECSVSTIEPFRPSRKRTLPERVMRDVLDHPLDYPFMLWGGVQTQADAKARESVRPVAEVAAQNQWFAVE